MRIATNSKSSQDSTRLAIGETSMPLMGIPILALVIFGFAGCGQTAKPVKLASTGQVYSYFGGPFSSAGVTSGSLAKSLATFDHATNQIGVSAFVVNQNTEVPTGVISGGFSSAGTGFLNVTESFAPNSSGVIAAQNPPLTGAWAVEIPGAGALANFLNVNSSGSTVTVRAAPTSMVEDAACPDFANPAPFLYVTVPNAALTKDTADYGTVSLTTQGSAVTFSTHPFLVGRPPQPTISVTGGCSNTNLGALSAYPLNSFGSPSNLELISTGSSGLLTSSFSLGSSTNSTGAFGGGTGVLGVAQPLSQVDTRAVVSAQYNGFLYAPLNTVVANYDITALATAFGNHAAGSQSCSVLQNSLVANNGQGARTVPNLPSPNSLYGGEFLTATSSGGINDPTGANGSENCDVVIDLGTQDSANSGLFPNATVFIGSNFPPFSSSQPWNCPSTNTVCSVSFPAAAVVGSVQGQFVIFVAASTASSPSAQLPDSFGNPLPQPVGIYLFQKAH